MKEQTPKSTATNQKSHFSANKIERKPYFGATSDFFNPEVTQKKGAPFFEKTPSNPFFKPIKSPSPNPPIQKQGIEEDESIKDAPIQKKENNTGLPDNLKAGIENLSGYSMDDVKVHYNSDKPVQLQALAYAQGSEIHLASGQEKHLAHEAWHVIQQKQGRVRPTIQLKGVDINDDAKLEHEADLMGEKAANLEAGVPDDNPDNASAPTPISQLRSDSKVVQRSSDEDQSGDSVEAAAVIAKAQAEIAAVDKMVDEDVEAVGFSEDAITHDAAVRTERKSIDVLLDMGDGNGEKPIFITPSQRAWLHQQSEQNGWNYTYTYQGVEYKGQFILAPKEVASLKRIGTRHTIQRAATVTGAFNSTVAKTPYAHAPNVANGTINYNGVNGQNVTTGAAGTSLNRQVFGTGVGATRPAQWAQFIAMTGGTNPWKQGHHISEKLGGEGTHDNLAPFTGSLNALHETRAESHVKLQTEAAQNDSYADFSTIPTYVGNPGLKLFCKNRFDGMSIATKLAAMVGAGVITAATAAAAGGVLSLANNTLAHTWIDNYVDGTFPTLITCTVRFIDHIPATGLTTATPQQVLTITNDQ